MRVFAVFVLAFLHAVADLSAEAALAFDRNPSLRPGIRPQSTLCPCTVPAALLDRLDNLESTVALLSTSLLQVQTSQQSMQDSVDSGDAARRVARDVVRETLSAFGLDEGGSVLRGLEGNISWVNASLGKTKEDVKHLLTMARTTENVSDTHDSAILQQLAVNISGVQSSLAAHGAGLTAVSNVITSLSNAVTSVSAVASLLGDRVGKVEGRGDVMSTSLEELTSAMGLVDGLRANVSSLQSKPPPLQVAFSVQFSADPGPEADSSGRYLFDHTITNLGRGYNSSTAQFSAPVSGLYVLFLKIMSVNHGGPVHVGLVTSLLGSIGHAFGQGGNTVHDQGSILVTCHLEEGEKVWVGHQGGPTRRVRGHGWSVFSGFLLQQDAA